MNKPPALGVDFGTTNTVVARADAHGGSSLVAFETPTGPDCTFRSTLSFNQDPSELTGRTVNPDPGRSKPIWTILRTRGSSSPSKAMRRARFSERPKFWGAAIPLKT